MKEQYKKLTGNEYKPASAPAVKSSGATGTSTTGKENKKPASAPAAKSSGEAEKLDEKITQQGDKVRELKSNKSASKVSKQKEKEKEKENKILFLLPRIGELYRQYLKRPQ